MFLACSRFVSSSRGVYSVMMALLSFFILLIIAFTIDGSGLLLDRARLADSLDQSALAITAENNSFRSSHSLCRNNNNNNNNCKKDRNVIDRDRELISQYIQYYMNNYNHIQKDNIHYDCQLNNTSNDGSQVLNELVCSVNASVSRHSLLPLQINKQVFIPESIEHQNFAVAFKRDKENVPQDVMLVVDYSANMYSPITPQSRPQCNGPNADVEQWKTWATKNCNTEYWDDSLPEAIQSLSDILFPESTDQNTNLNRLGITAYTIGAQPLNADDRIYAIPLDLIDTEFEDKNLEYRAFVGQRSWFWGNVGNNYFYATDKIPNNHDTDFKQTDLKISQGTSKIMIYNWLNNLDYSINSYRDKYAWFIAKYMPLYLGIYPDDLASNPEKYYDLDYNDLKLNKITPEQGVINSINHISKFDKDYLADSWLYLEKARGSERATYPIVGNRTLAGASFITQKKSTRWFDAKDIKNQELDAFLDPKRDAPGYGVGKLTVSGVIIGALAMTDINQKALPKKINKNTQRTLIIMNYGRDESIIENAHMAKCYDRSEIKNESGLKHDTNWIVQNSMHYKDRSPGGSQCSKGLIYPNWRYGTDRFYSITERFIDRGMCQKIREKLDSLNDPNYPQTQTKIYYIQMGQPHGASIAKGLWEAHKSSMDKWKACGVEKYYIATSIDKLKEYLKEAVSISQKSEEVGYNRNK